MSKEHNKAIACKISWKDIEFNKEVAKSINQLLFIKSFKKYLFQDLVQLPPLEKI